MRFSQNGWPAYSGTEHYTRFTAAGQGWWAADADVAVVFTEFIERFDAEVEEITQSTLDDWSYANRLVRGSATVVSNHGSATAIDINAVQHPRGTRGTFTRTKAARLRKIKNEITDSAGRPVLRLGMDFTTTVDDMHVEIDATAARVKQAANKIRRRKASAVRAARRAKARASALARAKAVKARVAAALATKRRQAASAAAAAALAALTAGGTVVATNGPDGPTLQPTATAFPSPTVTPTATPTPTPKPTSIKKPVVPKVTLHRTLKYTKGHPLMTGADVGHVQHLVGAKPDREFGSATKAKVIAWQRRHHLKADGVFGRSSAIAAHWAWKPGR